MLAIDFTHITHQAGSLRHVVVDVGCVDMLVRLLQSYLQSLLSAHAALISFMSVMIDT